MSLRLQATFAAYLLAVGSSPLTASDAIDLRAAPRSHATQPVGNIDAEAECFAIDLNVDPVVAEDGDVQVVAGVAIGVQEGFVPPEGLGPNRERAALTVGLREGSGRSAWLMWHKGADLINVDPGAQAAGIRRQPRLPASQCATDL